MITSGPLSQRPALVVGVALLFALLASCKQSDPAGAPAPPSRLAADTSWGTFHVQVTPEPAAIPLGKMFALDISVSPAGDHSQAAAGAAVAVDARMPAHNHGMNLQPRVTPVGEGRFRADGLLFHMPGTWELYVDVSRAAEMERATFVIHVD